METARNQDGALGRCLVLEDPMLTLSLDRLIMWLPEVLRRVLSRTYQASLFWGVFRDINLSDHNTISREIINLLIRTVRLKCAIRNSISYCSLAVGIEIPLFNTKIYGIILEQVLR
jgi:hypothetical protein